ncbi:c-type cytochrome [Kingella kingae]|uniref:c-type cytochrome n=1 Tax=Kingella kingae TaxID=504 RepID=UPI0025514805|nr:c-type cytochrome [Kingella kingae]MDK4527461.1 c-type cytochrome [Kingella kingae]MDK4542062.1 c-type cytochrome [Kingella kingae]MDK4561846.1 c-type cytochrome [Kingella kingae]MDK4601764.1 c-type cytochrome [Kingella kingae]MDK4631741.1 c-type cytochrome [Kingella kingae]
MKPSIFFAALVLTGVATAAAPADLAKGKQVAEQVCAACHGADGNNSIAMYPRLSGQHAAYIFKQTVDIKKGTRTTGAAAAMAPMVQNLNDDDIRNVSAYYATQQGKSGEANPKENPALGAKIYRGGIASKHIPACMSCHGPAGAGTPAGGTDVQAYPRLAGQHSQYVADQLRAYADGKRTSPANMMEDIAKRMSDEEMKAVGNFIQGLK